MNKSDYERLLIKIEDLAREALDCLAWDDPRSAKEALQKLLDLVKE